MSISQFLFSAQGRITRSAYWLKYVVPYTVIYITMVVLEVTLGMLDEATGIGMLSLAFSLVAFYPSIVIGIKRCHDRNRSGWFLLVSIIPLVNLWVLIELGFLRGTVGDNKYGSDPLAESAAMPHAAAGA